LFVEILSFFIKWNLFIFCVDVFGLSENGEEILKWFLPSDTDAIIRNTPFLLKKVADTLQLPAYIPDAITAIVISYNLNFIYPIISLRL
jgi:hypothetical protein